MYITIIGKKNRASAWEKHLRKLSIVQQVVISPVFDDQDNSDAVLIIDDSSKNLETLLNVIKKGKHAYLISRLSTDFSKLDKIYHSAEEANVNVQFSHWPSIASSTNWIKQQIDKPELIQITKETVPIHYKVDQSEFEHGWIDEIAFIVKWLGGNVHHIETKPIQINGIFLGLSVTLRFESRSVASISFSAVAKDYSHHRLFSGKNIFLNLDVKNQTIRQTLVNDHKKVAFKEKSFDPTDSAEWSVLQFIKSIQLDQPTIFNAYDALQTAHVSSRIKTLLHS